jgi:hypothetical protein
MGGPILLACAERMDGDPMMWHSKADSASVPFGSKVKVIPTFF